MQMYLKIFACLVLNFFTVAFATDQLTMTFSPPIEDVTIGSPLVIRCELSSSRATELEPSSEAGMATRISMFLHCPIAPWGTFCFQNCHSACITEKPGKCPNAEELSAVVCKIVHHPDGSIDYEYIVSNVTAKWYTYNLPNIGKRSGFFCQTAGITSPTVWLVPSVYVKQEVVEPPKTISTTTAITVLSTQGQKITTKTSPSAPAETNTNHANALVVKSYSMTHEFLIVFAIIVVCISALLNVFCCIRCALIRQYSKSPAQAHMKRLFCMSEEIDAARKVQQVLEGAKPNGSSQSANVISMNGNTQLMQQVGNSGFFITTDPEPRYMFNSDRVVPQGDEQFSTAAFPANQSYTGSLSAAAGDHYFPDGKLVRHQSGSGKSQLSYPTVSMNNFQSANVITWLPTESIDENRHHSVALAQQQLFNYNTLQAHQSQQAIQQHQQQQQQVATSLLKLSTSGGPSSRTTSIGLPDSSLLDPNSTASTKHSCHVISENANIQNLVFSNNEGPHVIGYIQPNMIHVSNQPSNATLVLNDTGQVSSNQTATFIPVSGLNQPMVFPWITSRAQPMGSSHSQLRSCVSNSIPQISNFASLSSSEHTATPPSQQDSVSLGGGAQSGKYFLQPTVSSADTKMSSPGTPVGSSTQDVVSRTNSINPSYSTTTSSFEEKSPKAMSSNQDVNSSDTQLTPLLPSRS